MKYIKFIILCLIMTISANNYAQSFTKANLNNTKWQKNSNEKNYVETLEFTRDSIIYTSYNGYNNNKIRFSKPYYLSNDKKEQFQNKKVKGTTSGKFIICWNRALRWTEYCQITKLSKDTLGLFYEAQPNYIGAANIYRTYKRIR